MPPCTPSVALTSPLAGTDGDRLEGVPVHAEGEALSDGTAAEIAHP
jgi:hypothetical protein